jgi:hypothetical protein
MFCPLVDSGFIRARLRVVWGRPLTRAFWGGVGLYLGLTPQGLFGRVLRTLGSGVGCRPLTRAFQGGVVFSWGLRPRLYSVACFARSVWVWGCRPLTRALSGGVRLFPRAYAPGFIRSRASHARFGCGGVARLRGLSRVGSSFPGAYAPGFIRSRVSHAPFGSTRARAPHAIFATRLPLLGA